MLTRWLVTFAAAATLAAALAGAALTAGTDATAKALGSACRAAGRTLAGSTGTASLRTYNDLIEDAGNAPDFCASNIVTNDNRSITIEIHAHNRSGFDAGDEYRVLFDTDLNPATGDSGADYELAFGGAGAQLGRWNGTSFDLSTPRSLTLGWLRDMGPVLRLSRAEFGNPTAFDFVFVSANGSDGDRAPDTGAWSYRLTPLKLTARALVLGPARAGKAFSARMLVTRSDFDVALTSGSVGCEAKVAGRVLQGVGRFSRRQAVCTWRLPRSSHGKRLTGSISASFQGAQARRSLSATVR